MLISTLAQRITRVKNPGAVVGCKPQVRVIPHGSRGGEQDHYTTFPQLIPGVVDELTPNASPLIRPVDGQIGKVAAVFEIGYRSGDAYQQFVLPGGYEQIGMLEHALDDARIIDRSAFGEPGPVQQVDEIFRFNSGLDFVSNQCWINPVVIQVQYTRGHVDRHPVKFISENCATVTRLGSLLISSASIFCTGNSRGTLGVCVERTGINNQEFRYGK